MAKKITADHDSSQNTDQIKKISNSRAIRDQAILTKALSGKPVNKIAEEMGLARETVSRHLNSDEMREKIKEVDLKLAAGIDDAIKCVLMAVKTDPVFAIKLLQNFGSFKNKMELSGGLTLEQLVVGSMKLENEDETK